MALDRATTIGERGETPLPPFERKGGIASEAGMSIGRFQIFLNTRGLSGVKCHVRRILLVGGYASFRRRSGARLPSRSIGRLGENPESLALFEELARGNAVTA